MKRLIFASALMLILLSLILTGCSKNKTVVATSDGIPLKKGATTIYTNLSVPAWVLYHTDVVSAIGIAKDFIKDGKSSSTIATEFAQQSLALNAATFSYDKELLANLPTEFRDEEPVIDLKLVPVARPDKINDAAYKLKPVGETSVGGYRFVLISTPDTKLNQDPVTVSAATLPEWCMQREVTEGEKYFYAVGAGEASTLTEAWQQAQQKALIKLAYYALKDMRSELHSDRSMEERTEIIDKAFANLNISFDKNWLFHRTVDVKDFYNVYMMLKLNK